MEEFKKIKNRAENSSADQSSDDEAIEHEVNKIFEVNQKKIEDRTKQHGTETSFATSHRNMTGILDETIAFVHDEGKDEHSDSDDDFKEFEDADVEEAEDRIYEQYKKHGQLGEDEINQLARNTDVSLLETSIVMSAKNGGYQIQPY